MFHCDSRADSVDWSNFIIYSSMGKNTKVGTLHTKIRRDEPPSELRTVDNVGSCGNQTNVSRAHVNTMWTCFVASFNAECGQR